MIRWVSMYKLEKWRIMSMSKYEKIGKMRKRWEFKSWSQKSCLVQLLAYIKIFLLLYFIIIIFIKIK